MSTRLLGLSLDDGDGELLSAMGAGETQIFLIDFLKVA